MSSTSKRRIALIGMPVIPKGEESILNGFLSYAKKRKAWEYVFSAEATADAIRFLLKLRCDGALVRLLTPEMDRLAKQATIPMVNVSTWLPKPGIPTVCRDDILIGQLAAEHLVQRGVRRFACVICPGGWYAKARAEGFRKTVEKAGFPCCTHVIKAHYREVSRPQEMTEADLRQLEAWLAGLRTPVGLFWTEDHLGEQLLRACRRCGLRVPQDVAVVSAPNRTSYCEAFDPPFSSVNSFEEEIGYLAAHWLDRLMSGEKMKTSPQTVPPSHVVTRKSSDTFAADDPDVARALQYIYEHLAEGINASEVINKLNLSRRTFYRRFEATTGQSPQAFIQNRRVRVALDIIAKDASLSLQEVALRCGFRDRNRMNLTIMNETGKTPQSWREEHRRAAEAADPLGMKES